MKILYDYKIFYQQRFGGISSYFYNLANELKKTDIQFLFYSPLHKISTSIILINKTKLVII